MIKGAKRIFLLLTRW